MAVDRCMSENSDSETKIAKSHLYDWATSFREFAKIAGISRLGRADLGIITLEAKARENPYQYILENRRAEFQSKFRKSVGGLVADYNKKISERLFERSFRGDVAAFLRWVGILNTSPSTTVLR